MTTAVRLTQAALDVLAAASAGDADVRVTQVALEVLYTPVNADARATQASLEIVFGGQDTDVYVTALHTEVARTFTQLDLLPGADVVDDFGGADSAVTIDGWGDNILADDEDGQGMEISANAIQGALLNVSNNSFYNSGPGAQRDMQVGVDVQQLPQSGQTMSLWARLSDAGTVDANGYEMRLAIGSAGVANDTVAFYRYEAATPTQISATIVLGGHISAGDTIVFSASGPGQVILEALRKGPEMAGFEKMGRVSDPGSPVSNPGKCGVGVGNGPERHGRFNNFRCGPPFLQGGKRAGSSGIPPGGAFASGLTTRRIG